MNTTESSSQIVSEEQQTEERTRRKRTRHALVFEDVETESPASVSDEDILITRGRGRGSIRGRGRGRRQRGGRLFRGRQFEEGEEEKLVRLHEERRQKADDMIDRLTDTEKTSMLKEVAVRQPAIILDVATILSTRDEEPHEPGPSVPVPSWCVCQKCPPMERDADKLCCGMAPQYCNSRRPEMGISITDPLTLHLQQTFGMTCSPDRQSRWKIPTKPSGMQLTGSIFFGYLGGCNVMIGEQYQLAVFKLYETNFLVQVGTILVLYQVHMALVGN